jgi:monoamine oxidase
VSGLYAAYLLQQSGVTEFVLFEARETLGGRIVSAPAMAAAGSSMSSDANVRDRVDLGAAWFWPGMQPQLDAVIRDLGIATFRQHEAGDMLVDRGYHQTPMRTGGFFDSPASARLAGGMASLTDALASDLNTGSVITGEAVRELRRTKTGVEIHSVNVYGHARTTHVEHVFLALPPRLIEASIRFEPALPVRLAQSWRDTPTWMAPHAKYVAVYEKPFWRDAGLSGEARSMSGPLGEIHDASTEGGHAALFGFFATSASLRSTVRDDDLRTHCRAQLVRLFGPTAATPVNEFIKDWSREPYTATADDIAGSSQHLTGAAADGPLDGWSGHITGIASEWSERFPGYVAGAIDAAQRGVQRLMSSLTTLN